MRACSLLINQRSQIVIDPGLIRVKRSGHPSKVFHLAFCCLMGPVTLRALPMLLRPFFLRIVVCNILSYLLGLLMVMCLQAMSRTALDKR
ncbi:uncharacterized protein FOBCDRAFT_223783 [Fusarium oxysporum Fo47]|uniref:uncharacterized protein n=1 Tax=Fusarium oxysporum Fo47 TaxID=660027 RepID=UPI002869E19A|nr:uncharacterized protein FOBCDRAFT_223783 [Fusarium oxysporum Fo47]WJG35349.1 hypothetical protein FOBCDRAFT_223783 [Fusarium oxysporum Fo47]